MTTTESSIFTIKTESALDYIEVSWPAVIDSTTSFLAPLLETQGKSNHQATLTRVAIILSLERVDDQLMLVKLCFEQPPQPRQVLRTITTPYTLIKDDEFWHLDAFHDEKCIASLTIDDEDELIFARSDLLPEAGFTGGTCNVPDITRLITGNNSTPS